MSALLKLCAVGLRQILRDGMLLIMLPAPFLMGGFLKLVTPVADKLLFREFGFSLVPWYSIRDTLVICTAPVMPAMVSAFLVMEERDEGVGAYLCITPAGGRTYLLARVALPMVWASASSVLAITLFRLSGVGMSLILAAVFIGTLQGLVVAMLIVALAGNKVEGLALSKLAGIFFMGIPAAWFVGCPYKYLFGFLPSSWMAEMLRTPGVPSPALAAGGIISSALWITSLTGVFLRRAGVRGAMVQH